MTDYPTLAEDLARAKDLLDRGKQHAPGCPRIADDESDQVLDDYQRCVCPATLGGAVEGPDIYAAYKLLESFVAEIEQQQPAIRELRDTEAVLREALPGTTLLGDTLARAVVAEIEQLQRDYDELHIAHRAALLRVRELEAGARADRTKRVTYDPEADAGYIYLQDPIPDGGVARSHGVTDALVLDYNAAGEIIGIEVLNVTRVMPALKPSTS